MDRAFLAWLHETRRCAVHGTERCGPYTVHHIRSFGGQKDDRRVIGLCAPMHLHDAGKFSIERLGKDKWQRLFGVDIEAEIARYNEDYALVEKPLSFHAPQAVEGTFGGTQIVSATRAATLP